MESRALRSLALAAGLVTFSSPLAEAKFRPIVWGHFSGKPITRPVVAIAAGKDRSTVLQDDGTLVIWGENVWDNMTPPPEKLPGALDIAEGWAHTIALMSDGTVVGWGGKEKIFHQTDVEYGQEKPPPGLKDVVAIAAGALFSAALRSDGTVVAWGDNAFRQCDVPANLMGVKAIAAGENHMLALLQDSTIVAWGDSTYGATKVPTDLRQVVAIAAGSGHSVALRADGTVVGWGTCTYSGGDCNKIPPEAAEGVVMIAAGEMVTHVLKKDGTLITWGLGTWAVPKNLKGIRSIRASRSHALALTSDGRVHGWSYNPYRIVGAYVESGKPPYMDGDYASVVTGDRRFGFISMAGNPELFGDGFRGENYYDTLTRKVKKIAYGGYHSVALLEDGTVHVVVADDRKDFIPREPLRGIRDVAAGSGFCAALKADGSIVVWGDSLFDGVLDYGVMKIPPGVSNVKILRASYGRILVVREDDSVISWGAASQSLPDEPTRIRNAVDVSLGMYHGVALLADSTVIAWGQNFRGQTDVPSDLKRVIKISAGHSHTLALLADGTVRSWGWDTAGGGHVPTEVKNAVDIGTRNVNSIALVDDAIASVESSSKRRRLAALEPGDYDVDVLSFDGSRVWSGSMRWTGNIWRGGFRESGAWIFSCRKNGRPVGLEKQILHK